MPLIDSVKKRAAQEWDQVKTIPALLAVAVVASFGVGWWINDLFHAERFALMGQQLADKRDGDTTKSAPVNITPIRIESMSALLRPDENPALLLKATVITNSVTLRRARVWTTVAPEVLQFPFRTLQSARSENPQIVLGQPKMTLADLGTMSDDDLKYIAKTMREAFLREAEYAPAEAWKRGTTDIRENAKFKLSQSDFDAINARRKVVFAFGRWHYGGVEASDSIELCAVIVASGRVIDCSS